MMEPNQITTAHILDIVFDGRNKQYGAYPLRKYYPARLGISVGIVLTGCLLILLGTRPGKSVLSTKTFMLPDDSLTISPAPQSQPELPQPLPKRQNVAQVQSTVPQIIPDEVFLEDTVLGIDEIKDAVISSVTVAGALAPGNEPPSSRDPVPVISQAPPNPVPVIYDDAAEPARFPGGPDGWKRYLERNLIYPEMAIENEKQGTVKVQFIVGVDGNISNVVALNDPGEGLADEAVRIISNGPKWTPAEDGGRKVISRQTQTITFRLN